MLYYIYRFLRFITAIIVLGILILVISKYFPQITQFYSKVFFAIKKYWLEGLQFLSGLLKQA